MIEISLDPSKKIASSEELLSDRIPHHVAIIMDGNRRWARENNMPLSYGHYQGAKALVEIVKTAVALKLQVLTLYCFSTENWKREEREVLAIMEIFKDFLIQETPNLQKHGIRLKGIGDRLGLASEVLEVLTEAERATATGQGLQLFLAVNYGGRNEICRATRKIVEDWEKQLIQKEEINETLFARYLDTSGFQDPELLIRTGGDLRISNFLLWQISYSEVYITETLWPEFEPSDFKLAIAEYQRRQRRMGR